MVDDILKEIFEDVQSMSARSKKEYLFEHTKDRLSKRDVSEESQWYAAKEKYGELEAYHVLADEWGCSTHEVKRKIKRWDLQWL